MLPFRASRSSRIAAKLPPPHPDAASPRKSALLFHSPFPTVGASPLRQQIGLGAAESIKSIEIFWPTTGKTQLLPGVPMEGYYTIKEGATAAVPFKLKSFPLKGAAEKVDTAG